MVYYNKLKFFFKNKTMRNEFWHCFHKGKMFVILYLVHNQNTRKL